MAQSEDSLLSRRATVLLGEVLELAAEVLPSSLSTDLHAMPGLLRKAIDVGGGDNAGSRSIARGSMSELARVHRLHRANAPSEQAHSGIYLEHLQSRALLSCPIEDLPPPERKRRRLAEQRAKIEREIDDKVLLPLIGDSQV